MKVVIIEDEALAAEKLERYLLKYDNSIEVCGHLRTVDEAVHWLNTNQEEISLLFMDIQLKSRLSFEIFQQLKVSKPVIFTTAYDEYAIDAFKVNSIDYLLKPITYTRLSQALNKFKQLQHQWTSTADVTRLLPQLQAPSYKDRFMVRRGNHIQSVQVEDIACFVADGRMVTLIHQRDSKYILDFTLTELEKMLNPKLFFRANRTFILYINAIKNVVVYSNSRLKVSLQQKLDKEIIVSREKVGAFKEWLAGGK